MERDTNEEHGDGVVPDLLCFHEPRTGTPPVRDKPPHLPGSRHPRRGRAALGAESLTRPFSLAERLQPPVLCLAFTNMPLRAVGSSPSQARKTNTHILSGSLSSLRTHSEASPHPDTQITRLTPFGKGSCTNHKRPFSLNALPLSPMILLHTSSPCYADDVILSASGR